MAKTKDGKFNVGVDALETTVQVPPHLMRHVWTQCCLLILCLIKLFNHDVYQKARRGYRLNFKIPIGYYSCEAPSIGDKHLYMQIAPYSPKKGFIRMSLNGHPYNAGDLYECHRWLKTIFPEFDAEKQVSITRIDFAVDGKTQLSDLAFMLEKARSAGRYFGPNGEPQNLYSGNAKSDLQLTCYKQDGEFPSRTEFRVRNTIKLPNLMSKIIEMKLLHQLKCYDLTTLNKSGMNQWLLRYIRDVGVTSALRVLKSDKTELKVFKQILAWAELEYFDVNEVENIFCELIRRHSQIWLGDFSSSSKKSKKDIQDRQVPFDKFWGPGMKSAQQELNKVDLKLFGMPKFE